MLYKSIEELKEARRITKSKLIKLIELCDDDAEIIICNDKTEEAFSIKEVDIFSDHIFISIER